LFPDTPESISINTTRSLYANAGFDIRARTFAPIERAVAVDEPVALLAHPFPGDKRSGEVVAIAKSGGLT